VTSQKVKMIVMAAWETVYYVTAQYFLRFIISCCFIDVKTCMLWS